MTRAQVLATESAKPTEVRESSGEWVVQYDSIRFGEQPCRALYVLANDKLVRAKYVFTAKHQEPNDFIRDFRAIAPLLKEQFGTPFSERAFWSDDALQDEPKSYLEQDRASAADILPSDIFAGPSIAAGHLKLYTQWRGDRTRILHGLSRSDSGILHQIEFLSVELEKLEADTRGGIR